MPGPDSSGFFVSVSQEVGVKVASCQKCEAFWVEEERPLGRFSGFLDIERYWAGFEMSKKS